ncbi:MAG: helical backbone metal receptor [Kofleriaceae bacterium]
MLGAAPHRLLLGALALAAALTACSRHVDEAPATGSAAAGPRVVSLTPSATEIVAALGATELLIAVDDYSTYPPAVASLPKVGSFLAPNLEVIVRLRPTLVLADDIHAEAAAALADAGIATLQQPVHGLADVEDALTAIGARLGRADAAAARRQAMQAAIDAARRRQPASRPRVVAIIDREIGGLGGLVAAGTGSWLDTLLALVGAENALASAGVRYPKISVEEILAAQPDVIVDASYAADAAAPMGPWQGLAVPAVREGRVLVMKEPFVLAPSPRLAEALAVVGRVVDEPAPSVEVDVDVDGHAHAH